MTASASEWPLTFRCGQQELLGVVHGASGGAARVGILIVVGGPQYRVGSHRQFTLMARALAASGFAAMRFDYRGMGDSDGETQAFTDIGDDLRAAFEAFLLAVPSLERVVLWGLCDAASAILLNYPRDPRVGALVLVNPWVRSESGEAQAYLKHYYLQRLLQPSFWRKVASGGFSPLASVRDLWRKYRLAQREETHGALAATGSFVEGMRAGLDAFARPVLVQISGEDLTAAEFTVLTNASPVWRRMLSRPNVTMVRFETADHTFSARSDLDRATEQCRRWLESKVDSGQHGAAPYAATLAR